MRPPSAPSTRKSIACAAWLASSSPPLTFFRKAPAASVSISRGASQPTGSPSRRAASSLPRSDTTHLTATDASSTASTGGRSSAVGIAFAADGACAVECAGAWLAGGLAERARAAFHRRSPGGDGCRQHRSDFFLERYAAGFSPPLQRRGDLVVQLPHLQLRHGISIAEVPPGGGITQIRINAKSP